MARATRPALSKAQIADGDREGGREAHRPEDDVPSPAANGQRFYAPGAAGEEQPVREPAADMDEEAEEAEPAWPVGAWSNWRAGWGAGSWAGKCGDQQEDRCEGPWGQQGLEETSDDSDDGTQALPYILPSVISGWLLLQRSGLDAQERAPLMAASRNSVELADVEAALRAQWSDSDLTHRDSRKGPSDKKFHGTHFGEDSATWYDPEEQEASPEPTAYFGHAGWEEQG